MNETGTVQLRAQMPDQIIPAAKETSLTVPERKNPRPFQPGPSGNPSGRRMRTKEQQEAIDALRKLAPEAVQVLGSILADGEAPVTARIKVAEIVLDRTCGKPEASVRVTSVRESLNESRAYIVALVQKAQERLADEGKENWRLPEGAEDER